MGVEHGSLEKMKQEGKGWLPKLPEAAGVAGWFRLREEGACSPWAALAVVMLLFGVPGVLMATLEPAAGALRRCGVHGSGADALLGIGCAFTLVGGVLASWCAASRWRGSAMRVRMDRAAAPLGGTAQIWWELKAHPRWLRRLRRLSVVVEAAEQPLVERRVVTRVPVLETTLLSEMAAGRGELRIPAGAMHSLECSCGRILWSVLFRGEIEGEAAPWEKRFGFVVLPGPPARSPKWSPDLEALKETLKLERLMDGLPAETEGDAPASKANDDEAPPETPERSSLLKKVLLAILVVPGAVLISAMLIVALVFALVFVLPTVGTMELFKKLRYGKCRMKLGLDDEQRAYAPGELVKGWVEWDVDRPPRQWVVCLRWGEHPQQVAQELRLENPAKSERREFALRVPAGPYSYEGLYGALHWRVELRGAQRVEMRSLLAVSPTGRAIKLQAVDGDGQEKPAATLD